MAKIEVAVPLLHISCAKQAVDFYTGRLGFQLDFASDLGGRPSMTDPCFCSVSRDGVRVNLSSHRNDSVPGAVVVFVVNDVDTLHAEFAGKGAPVDPKHPVDQSWGTRETFFRDPDGNSLCFQQVRN